MVRATLPDARVLLYYNPARGWVMRMGETPPIVDLSLLTLLRFQRPDRGITFCIFASLGDSKPGHLFYDVSAAYPF